MSAAARVSMPGKLPLMMHLVTESPTAQVPGWQLDYLSAGTQYTAFVRARNQQAADHEARIQLGYEYHNFDTTEARLVRCVQTS